jgi:hypothetical protein
MPTKLTRKQIAQGLDSVPIDTLLLGSQTKETRLTSKQKLFAREVALGKSKAQAYRDVYDTKTTNKKTQGDQASKLSRNPSVATEIKAIEREIDVQKYQTPVQLRSLVIHQLTKHALDDSFPAAQRLKALQLLGNVTEIGAFTERKEVLNVTQSTDIKENLLAKLKQLTGIRDVIDITPSNKDDDLLSEIRGASVKCNKNDEKVLNATDYVKLLPQNSGNVTNLVVNLGDGDPTPPPSPDYGQAGGGESTHTIPHKESADESDGGGEC